MHLYTDYVSHSWTSLVLIKAEQKKHISLNGLYTQRPFNNEALYKG